MNLDGLERQDAALSKMAEERAAAVECAPPQANPGPQVPSQKVPPPELPLPVFLGWVDDCLCWRCAALDQIDEVGVDGIAVERTAWSITATGALQLRATAALPAAMPPAANLFDARPHTITIVGRNGDGPARLTTRYCSVYRGALTEQAGGRLRGWIVDDTCPQRPVRLIAELNGAAWPHAMHVLAADPRPYPAPQNRTSQSSPAQDGSARADIAHGGVPHGGVPHGDAAQGHDAQGDNARGDNAQGHNARGHNARGDHPENRGVGFTISWNPWRHGTDIDLRIDGTDCHPFGYLRHLTLADPAAAPPWSTTGAASAAGTLRPSYGQQAPPRVAVIVPVYGGLEDTLICLRSLRASQDRIGREVIVIDDASPDTGLSQAVADFAAEAGFTHLRNPHNVGFVATANRGLRLRPDHDVVLLNADTEVPDGWLDRLHQAVARDPLIATATPLSNNATIMSLPEIGGSPVLPYRLSLAEIDALCRDLNGDLVQDVPTGHGFCLYIRRNALDEVGDLDEALFGRGYGEENDFCLRARGQGWRNVVVAGLFVRHVGSVSFGAAQSDLLARNLTRLNHRHPGYAAEISAYIEADPLRHARRRPQLSLWRRQGPPVVMITLALPGGTGRHVRGLTRQIAQTGRLVLWLHAAAPPAAGTAASSSAGTAPNLSAATLTLSDPLSGVTLSYPGEDGAGEALADVLALEPEFIHVHHLIDLPNQVEAFLRHAGIPYVVTVHDYFFGCPRVTLIDDGGTFCGAPAARYCAPCLAAAPPHEALHASLRPLGRDNEAWRAKWAVFLAGACQVIVPSAGTAHTMRQMFPALEMTVRPHAAATSPAGPPGAIVPAPSGHRDATRVAVIGALGPHKGAAQLHDLVRYCHRHEVDLRFVVIGHSDRDEVLARYPNVELAGVYEPDAVLPAIAAAGCTTALFLSIWPETYCFTLSEALLAGLTPVAFDIGAIGERLRALGHGTLLPPHSPAGHIVAALQDAGASAASAVPLPAASVDREYATLFGDYYATGPDGLTPGGSTPGDLAPDELAPGELAGNARRGDEPHDSVSFGGARSHRVAAVRRALAAGPLITVTETAGISGDLWCKRRFGLAVFARRPLVEATLKLWIHPDHLSQNLQAWIEGGSRQTIWLNSAQIGLITLPVPDWHRSVLRVFAQFDFVTPLAPPDRRQGGAKLVGLSCTCADGGSAHYSVMSTDDAEPGLLELVAL